MKYERLKTLNKQDFKCLTGINLSLFHQIVLLLRKQNKRKRLKARVVENVIGALKRFKILSSR